MNYNKNITIIILFTIVLLTGFILIAYTQSAHAFSIDFSGLPGFGGNQGLGLLKGPKGDIGPQGPPGPKGDKGDTGATGQGVEFGHLNVIVHTNDFINPGNPQPKSSDFTIHISGNNQSPDTFQGAESGTDVKLGFGDYQVTEDIHYYYNAKIKIGVYNDFSQDCSGIIHPAETKVCTVTNTIRALNQ